MKIRTNKYLVPKGYTAITLYPFVFVAKEEYKENKVLMNHEAIHLQQQKELLLVPFFIIYIVHYLLLFAWYRNHYRAYENVIFEQEAYSNQADLNYLKKRKLWQFLRKKA